MNDDDVTLGDLRRHMAGFVRERQWERFHQPKNLAMSIAIEAAEIMEHFQWLEGDRLDEALADEDFVSEVRDEMADTLAYLLSLANALGVDLAGAFEAKMRRNEQKYPPEDYLGRFGRA